MNLNSPKVPPLLLIIYKIILMIVILSLPFYNLYFIYRCFRYRWQKISYDYLCKNGVYLVHVTDYKNVLNIENDQGFIFKSKLKTIHLVNCSILLFTLKPKSGVWFFLDEPNGNQLWFNTQAKSLPSLLININKSKEALEFQEIYLRKIDNAVMVVTKDLEIPQSAVCFGKELIRKINLKTIILFSIGFKKTIIK